MRAFRPLFLLPGRIGRRTAPERHREQLVIPNAETRDLNAVLAQHRSRDGSPRPGFACFKQSVGAEQSIARRFQSLGPEGFSHCLRGHAAMQAGGGFAFSGDGVDPLKETDFQDYLAHRAPSGLAEAA